MNNNSGYDESCMDDGAWDSLFKMAENAEYESDFEGLFSSFFCKEVIFCQQSVL